MIDIMGGARVTGQQSFSEQNKNQWQTVSHDNETNNNKTLSTSIPPLLLHNRQKLIELKVDSF